VDDVVLVGVDHRQQARDAATLGATLANELDDELVLVHVYPYDPLAGRMTLGAPPADPLAEEAQALLDGLARTLSTPARTLPVPGTSVVGTLHAAAEREGAELLVVGSAHRSRLGRVLLGSHTDRVLQGAPCAVGVAPRGLAGEEWGPRTVAAGFDGSEESGLAVAWARRLAEATGAQLLIVAAVDAPSAAWDPYEHDPDWRLYDELHRAELERQISTLAGPLTEDVRTGDAADALVEASRDADLLVLGSRGYGPLRRVLPGGTVVKVVRAAACPVVVVPRDEQE
jgi:nucleotide-binding universal stress UspA family protein